MESSTPLIQYRRELRTDSGGPGTYRGGLGQWTEVGYRGDESWAVSAMVDRIHFPATGLHGGKAGAPGEFLLNGKTSPQPKALLTLAPANHVHLNPPGGGGYGDPYQRPVAMVLHDVINGYVSLEAAEEYGVVIRYRGSQEQLVRPPELYVVDEAATALLRAAKQGD
jgi:N-methylhydantoinase B